MPRDRSREWLERLLSCDVIPADGLATLPSEGHDEGEGLYLEYKSGRLLTDGETDRSGKKRDAADVLRQYVSAFANSDGGLLVIGYKEGEKARNGKLAVPADWDDAKAPGGSTLKEWATRGLTQMLLGLTVVGSNLLRLAVSERRKPVTTTAGSRGVPNPPGDAPLPLRPKASLRCAVVAFR